MILIDLNSAMIASLMALNSGDIDVDENMLRHFCLNAIRSYVLKFKSNAPVVLCDDPEVSWRREIFPQYKQRRREKREEDAEKWKVFFGHLSKIKQEFAQFLPYVYLKVNRAEADDLIAILAKSTNEPSVIVSNDGDFVQLLTAGKNLKIWSPAKGIFMETPADPDLETKRFVMQGDSGDGVPNILSDDDCFVNTEKRQKPLRKTLIEEIVQLPVAQWRTKITPEKNIQRNLKLIDFNYIPDDVRCDILEAYEDRKKNLKVDRMKLLTYLSSNNCRLMIEKITDF